MHQLQQVIVLRPLLTSIQLHVCSLRHTSIFFFPIIISNAALTLYFNVLLAGFYTETITLNLSSSIWPIRIECRAFLIYDGIPVVPCCDKFNYKTLCQPDTGIARVIVDIVDLNDPSESLLCQPGIDLNSVRPLVVDCHFNDPPKYCKIKDVNEIQNWPTLSKKIHEIKYFVTSTQKLKGKYCYFIEFGIHSIF